MQPIGMKMWGWVNDLFPLNRSITGDGVRETLYYIKELVPQLEISQVPSGTKVFDWIVPEEWSISEAWIKGPDNSTIVDFSDSNLHVIGYSTPIDKVMSLEELQKNLYSLPEQPDAIPYVTSYYEKKWGFCLKHSVRESLRPGEYHVYIKSRHSRGVMNYGEILIKGDSKKEIFLSTYICHPSMANNELSGPAVTTALAQWILSLPKRRYSYRIVFVPETIGSLLYMSKHLEYLKRHVIAGFNITCVGDDRAYSYLPSRNGGSLSDRIAKHVLKHFVKEYVEYSWLDRGSDERQYCAPGADLPVATICRSKYGCYPEYHTSLDNMDLVTPSGLQGGVDVLQKAIYAIENNFKPVAKCIGEPQLGRRGLYRQTSIKTDYSEGKNKIITDLLSYADGEHDLIAISDKINAPISLVAEVAYLLQDQGLLQLN